MRHPVTRGLQRRSGHPRERWALSLLGSAAIVGALLLPVGAEANSADVVVNTTSDVADFGGAQQVGDLPGPDGKVSLREAITAANNTAGPQVIGFAIPASDPGCASGVCTIRPVGFGLPVLTDDRTTIDGSTQTSFAGNSNPSGPEIELNGSLAPIFADGLSVSSSNNRIHALAVNGFSGNGIGIGGSSNAVTGCYIGVDLSGSSAVANENNGVELGGGTANRIGGTIAAEHNVISGNKVAGVQIHSGGNVVQGNFIGTDRTGSVDVGNGSEGVLLNISGPANTLIRRNVISGNDNTGIFVTGHGNTIRENLIGTDATGTSPLGNPGGGVLIGGGTGIDADGTSIIGNVVSANGQAGIWFVSDPGGSAIDDTLAIGNLIGTNVNGKVAPGLGNSPSGVDYNNVDGTGNVLAGNIIAGNGNGTTAGVWVSAGGLTVVGNSIFENVGHGVTINTASGNIVRRNSVRANAVDGIYLAPTASGNSLLENFLRANVEHDCHDDSIGSGTAGTANTWRRNNGQTSQPPGLCRPGG